MLFGEYFFYLLNTHRIGVFLFEFKGYYLRLIKIKKPVNQLFTGLMI